MQANKLIFFLSHIAVLISTLFFSAENIAGPVIKLCIEHDCKHPAQVEISDASWSLIKDLYKAPFQSDKDEQDNIVTSIALIEKEAFIALASHISPDRDAEQQAKKIFSEIGADNHYRNIKNYLGLLLDKHLVTRHVLRNTIKLKSWAGIEKDALLLQSITDSQLYLLKVVNVNLGYTPVIMPYKNISRAYDDSVIKPAVITPASPAAIAK